MISYEDFKKTEIKIGRIISAEKIPETDKLLCLKVDFGMIPFIEALSPNEEKKEERDVRQIISGIALHFPDLLSLIGVKCAFVTNLEPRIIRGYESQGMILAIGGADSPFSLLRVNEDVKEGSAIK